MGRGEWKGVMSERFFFAMMKRLDDGTKTNNNTEDYLINVQMSMIHIVFARDHFGVDHCSR